MEVSLNIMSNNRKRYMQASPGGLIRILIITMLFVFAFPQPTYADTLIVDRFDEDPEAIICDDEDLDDCSLRGAILHANAMGGSDTIYLTEGTYQLSISGLGEDVASTGDLDITEALTINGAGSSLTIIDGGALDRVFEVMPGVNLSLTGVTVQNGSGLPAGGIYNRGILALDDVFVSNNIGDGIMNELDLTVENSKVDNNTGYGIESFIPSTPPNPMVHIFNSTISENSLSGIYTINTTLILDEGIVQGNLDGGIFAMGSVTIVDSTISANSSTSIGGGIAIINGYSDVIAGSTISGNTATGDGGGMYFWGLTMGENHLALENVTLSGNQADGHGGGLVVASGAGSEVALYNVTITDNTADLNHNDDGDGGGIYNNNGARVLMQNSILAANVDATTSGSNVPDCSGALDSGDYNLIGAVDGTCTITGATIGNQVGTILSPLDPMIGGLAENGGPTDTHALLTSSPAIDAGNPAGCTALGGTPLLEDQRGWPRPIDGDFDSTATCDIGAFESVRPGNLQASDGTYTDKILITWDAVPGATSYELYRDASATGIPGLIASPTGTTYDDTIPTPGRDYWYWVKVCYGPDCSDFSESDGGWRSVIPPGNVQASDGTHLDKVAISWDPAAGANTYRVYRAASELGTKVQIGSPPACTFDDTTALPGKTYYYWVTSCAWGNCGGYSAYDTGWRFGYLIHLPLIMR